MLTRQDKYRKSHPWIKTLIYIRQRCNNVKYHTFKWYGGRGIKCLITSNELKELWFRDKAYEMSQPSIDRKEVNGNYEFGNCQFIEMYVNRIKDHTKRK